MRRVLSNGDKDLREQEVELTQVVHEQGMAIDRLMKRMLDLEQTVARDSKSTVKEIRVPRKKQDLEPDEQLLMKLKLLINEQQLYKKDSVELWEVAAELNISQKRLKEVVSITRYYNLKNLLNHYRITTACQMMLIHPAFSIDAIAIDSGFKSLKSFYRWFQREVGMSPTDYKRKHLQIEDEEV